MKNFLIGLSKFVLGIILAMLIMSLAGLSMARYFMTRMVEQPERPTYDNDLPEDQRPASPPTGDSDAPDEDTQASDGANSEPAARERNSEPASSEKPADEPAQKPQDESDENDYEAYATTDLNLRSGPGTSYDTIGGVRVDEGLTVLAEEDGWLNIRLSDGTEGWVSGNYIAQ